MSNKLTLLFQLNMFFYYFDIEFVKVMLRTVQKYTYLVELDETIDTPPIWMPYVQFDHLV